MQIQTSKSYERRVIRGGTVFSCENVSVLFNNISALKKVSLKVSRGEILFVTGISGAGKTTLLRLLAGEIEACGGRLKLLDDGQFITRVFQDLRLLQDLSVKENLYLAFDNSIYQSKEEFQKEMLKFCKFFSITNHLDLKISDCNGGLKQQVALIRAILSKPEVLLLDEPTSSLDTENALKVYEILEIMNSKLGMTCVWATHNKELIKKFNGRIVYLDKGKLVYSGHACFI